MSPNRRIALNMLATYGRSLLALVCGLFSGRWLLMALGEVDYGLLGLVGGLSAFVVFFNDLLSGAVSRYYAVSVGEATTNGCLEDCHRWFCSALTIHTVLPVLLLAIGYPAGLWAVKSFLAIPQEKVATCVWVWRFVCLSCFVGMVNVPFRAMYVAKQYIAELTIYSVATTILNFFAALYMANHEKEWLAVYACWTCMLSVVPHVIIAARAVMVFPECRVKRSYFFDMRRLRDLGAYAMYRFVGAFSSMVQSQGSSILVNKFLGPRFNATMTVSNTVASHTVNLSAAMSGAIGPAIYNAYGAKDRHRLYCLVNCASKAGAFLYMVFMVPVVLEIDGLFSLWLKTPPPQASVICVFVLMAYFTERITDGEVNAIYATGRIARFQIVLSVCCIVGLVLAWLFMANGLGILGLGFALVIFKTLIMIARVAYARVIANVSAWRWVASVFCPLVATCAICVGVGLLPRLVLNPSIWRIAATTLIVQLVLWPMAWKIVLGYEERNYIMGRIRNCIKL